MASITEKFNNFLSDNPRIAALYNFITHPSIWRIFGLATASIVTILSGGAIVPIIGLALTFTSSLISVVAKAIQIRAVERFRLQKAFVEEIKKKEEKNKTLKYYVKIKGIVNSESKGPYQNFNTSKSLESNSTSLKKKAFLKTIRDIGLENIAPIALASITLAFNALGIAVYAGTLIFGIGKISGYAALKTASIGSEFFKRVENEKEEQQIKDEIDKICEKSKIPQYERQSTNTLYGYFKNRLFTKGGTNTLKNYFKRRLVIEESLAKISKFCEEHKIDPEKNSILIKQTFNSIIEETKLPELHTSPAPQIIVTLWSAIRPWGERYEARNMHQELNKSLASTDIDIPENKLIDLKNHVNSHDTYKHADLLKAKSRITRIQR